MKSRILAAAVSSVIAASALYCSAAALNGEPYIHDPSTIAFSDGKYYTFGTGSGGLMSDDGWTWRSGAVRPGGGAAPDVIKVGDRYLVAYGTTGGGLGGGHNGTIRTMWNKTLDPQSPNFEYTPSVLVASSDGIEDNDAIDPSLLLDPTDGRLWCSYGTFFGFIRLIELDPKTGARVEGNKALDIGIDLEGTDLVYRDGWYYLLGNHGTCCNGATSTYNIVVGRAKTVTGPYIDNMGQPMLKGGGKMVAAASGRFIGLGHFGRIDLGDGVERFSMHYEADLDRSGRSVLDIRPLMWKDGWPIAGDNIQKETTFTIDAAGAALAPAGDTAAPGGARQWTITPMPDAGGYLGMPYMKITEAGGTRALAVNANKELAWTASFTGAPEQLWRLDQMIDGSWRIMPKTSTSEVLTSGGGVTKLAKVDFKNAGQHWNLKDVAAFSLAKEATVQIQSGRSGFALEIAVDGTPIGGRGGGGRGRGGGGAVTPVALPDPAQVIAGWPKGNLDLRIGDYMLAAHQKWTVSPLPGTPVYHKITIAGTNRALAATADREITTVPEFSGRPEQQWRIEALPDGGYSITPREIPGTTETLALTAVGGSTPSLAKFDPKSDRGRWNFRTP